MATPRGPSTALRFARDDNAFIVLTTRTVPAQLRESARDHPDRRWSADLWSGRKASAECGQSDSTRPENATDKFPFARRRCQPNRQEFPCAVRRGAASPNSSATLPEMENQERTQCTLLGIYCRCGEPPLRSQKFVLGPPLDRCRARTRDRSKLEFRPGAQGFSCFSRAYRDERPR